MPSARWGEDRPPARPRQNPASVVSQSWHWSQTQLSHTYLPIQLLLSYLRPQGHMGSRQGGYATLATEI